MAVFDLRGQVSADVSPFNRAMDASAKAASGAFSDMASAAGMFIGNGVIRHFVRATSAANLFGQKMADISAIADYNIKSLRTSILGLENVYGRASNVANTMYEIISSGIRGSQADILAYQKTAKQAAVSIKADLYDTANAMTNLTNAYGSGVRGVKEIADMLFITVREGKANGNELARTLGLVTNTAAEAGVSLAEMSAAISILSRTQSASQSMIGLNQLLNAIIKPTIEAQQEAQAWGIELSATAIKTKGLAGVLQELHEKTGGNVRALNAMLGNIRAMRAGVSLTGKQFENFMSVLKMAEAEIGSGVAFEAFKKQTNTAAQAIENLSTQIDKTYIKIGSDLEPISRKLATNTESWLKSLTSDDLSSTIYRWVMYFGAVAAGIKGIKSTTDLFAKSVKRLSSSLEASAKHNDALSKSTKITANGMRDVEVHANKALAAIQAMSKSMEHAARNSVLMNSGFNELQSSIQTPVPLTVQQTEAAKRHLIAQTLKPENLKAEAIANLKKTGVNVVDYSADIENMRASLDALIHKRDIASATSTALFRSATEPSDKSALNSRIKAIRDAAQAEYDALRAKAYKEVSVKGKYNTQLVQSGIGFPTAIRTPITRYKDTSGKFVSKAEVTAQSAELTALSNRLNRLDAILEKRGNLESAAAKRYEELLKKSEDLSREAAKAEQAISELSASITKYSTAQIESDNLVNAESSRIRRARNRRYVRAELLERLNRQMLSDEGRAQMRSESQDVVARVRQARYEVFNRYNAMRNTAGLPSIDADTFWRKEIRQELSRQMRSSAGRRQMRDDAYDLVGQMRTQRRDSVIERYLRRYAGRLNPKEIESVRKKVAAAYEKDAEVVGKMTRHQAQVVARFNRRFGSAGKLLTTNTYTAALRMSALTSTFALLRRRLSAFGRTIGTAAMNISLWGGLAATAASLIKSHIEAESERTANKTLADADTRDIPTLRKLAYTRLGTLYKNKNIDDAEYRTYYSAITLASSREQLAKLYQELVGKETKVLKETSIEEATDKNIEDYNKTLKERLAKIKVGTGKADTNTMMQLESAYNAKVINRKRIVNASDLSEEYAALFKSLGVDKYMSMLESDRGFFTTTANISASDRFKTELLKAFTSEDWQKAVEPIKNALQKAAKYRYNTDIKELAVSMLGEIDKLSAIRGKSDRDRAANEVRRDAQFEFFNKQIDTVFSRFEDAVIDELTKTKADARIYTVDSSGRSSAVTVLEESAGVLARAKLKNKTLVDGFMRLLNDAELSGSLSSKDKELFKKQLNDRLMTAKGSANRRADYNKQLEQEHVTKLMESYENRSYTKDGARKTADERANVLRDMLSMQFDNAVSANTPEAKRAYRAGADKLQKELDELIADEKEKYTDRLQARRDAGLISDAQMLQEQSKYAKAIYDKELAALKKIPTWSNEFAIEYKMQSERVAKAGLEYRKSIAEMKKATDETASSMRSNLMGQIKNFAKDRDSKGRMTNDALYHSINLMSRLGGGTAIQTSKGMRISVGNGRFANFKDAQSAQTAVSRSLDAYIMSQQYAEANKGRTVVDIYNLLKQNIGKGITVN